MSWLDRQSFLGADSEQRLGELTVGIIGLGGGGSHVAQQLAHVGVGGFVVIDDDRIDDTNLNRLVGATLLDVRRRTRKVDIATRVIRAVNPKARIELHPHLWQEVMGALQRCDVIFGCVDNVRGKDELEAFCRRLLIPYIDQGMDVHSLDGRHLVAGQVVLSLPGSPCLRCLGIVTEDALDDEGRNYGAAGGKPQVVWPNAMLASSAVGLFMQLVTPWHDAIPFGECLEYDGNAHTVVRSDRMKYLTPQGCIHRSQSDVGDPSFDVRRVLKLGPVDVDESTAQADAQVSWSAKFWRRLLALVSLNSGNGRLLE